MASSDEMNDVKPPVPQQSTFTPAQRNVLINQRIAGKLIEKLNGHNVRCVMPESWMARLRPPPLNAPASSAPARLTQEEIEMFREQAMLGAKMRNIAITQRPGPLFTISALNYSAPLPITGGEGYLEPAAMEADVASLILGERQRQVAAELARRRAALEAAVANPAAPPGMRYRSDSSAPPLGAALLQLRSLRALPLQRELRAAVDAEGREIMDLPEKQYKSMRKTHRTTLIEAARREIAARAELAASRAKDVKDLLGPQGAMKDLNSTLKDLRVQRNRGVMRIHERLTRSLNRLKEDDRSLRMAALKAHDFEAYQEMLRRQAGSTPAADERYAAISKFLADTEAYLHRLASKIAAVKISAEQTSAAARAMADARARGLSEDEVTAAAHAAAAEAATGTEALRAATEGAEDAQSRYYALAHSNREEIVDQPRLLRPPGNAKLREYQIVGLQWMVSLYNNHLNGILADEMGLGKTVQVMSLIAYLMEKKANYGPHLIIVPNAVMVNWKSELTQWLPSARCVYYVGGKEERARKYATEVQPLQFNVLVTTYEFIMRDRAKLSKIDWQYIIIDEAQRMKDRQSKLAKDLDRFNAARRLLLSGTPLQNDLVELWSLLNLLLPDVFDDKKLFAEWFGDAIGGGGGGGGGGDDWLEKEKRVVVIHRLHQILEPFMLRRQVEDVESKLPPKIAHTVRVPMSAHQSVVYTWVKTTGTLRLDPAAPVIGKVRREFASLNNKCMELRKLCNHPLLSYPPPSWAVGANIVRQCGKMVTLDRMLVKLKAAGHRVLLFSAMTKLLDLLEVYLSWRELPASLGGGKMKYLRIDGSTALEDRETAIQRFNAPDSDAFVFLLSIRAAGRGLNLQSSDTVVIYDPDPNPKNEEQAIARSHRIGQTKEVRVFHLEAVTDAAPGSGGAEGAAAAAAAEAAATAAAAQPAAPPVEVKAEEGAPAAAADGPAAAPPAAAVKTEDDSAPASAPAADGAPPAGPSTEAPPAAAPTAPPAAPPTPAGLPRRLYGDSIESVMRNQIQKMKIEMANEVIDAGRFDQRTSMEERRSTLEALLQDQDRALKAVNTVPTPQELNVMLARGPDELALFEKLDEEPGAWFDPTRIDEVPAWMRWSEADLRSALEEGAKHKVDVEAEMAALTGTVLHHHAPPESAAKPARKVSVKAPAAPRAVPAASALTTTTTRSLGREEDEEEEVGMADNDEEEEILDQNIVTDDTGGTATATATEGAGGAVSGVSGGSGMRHIQSTAAMRKVPSGAVSSPGGGGEKRPAEAAVGEEGEDGAAAPPEAKRKRTLSVHFEGVDDDEGMPPPPPQQPPANGDV